ncbi:MAG TPA: beta-ketoacyl synthase N-terminal-like domain-containing protein [Thermoleophilaceae bacterium]|jgi:acyl transferase domain-containing protein
MPANGESSKDHRALLEQAVRQLRAAHARAEAAESAVREPIAVVGAGVRFPPNAQDLDRFWAQLRDGVDAVAPLRLRTDGRRDSNGDGASPEHWIGALRNVDGFDADFFGISRAEATHMDPQQRLALEVAWEAIEDAGIPAERLRERTTGVFLGVYGSDYVMLQLGRPESITAYTGSGGAHSIAANRLSYLLDLDGPSVAVDTACSSSLVAVHLACRALRAGDCDYAIVGGVNLILSPLSTAVTEKVLPLAPGGRCRTFDAGAEGIVRAEGCGMVLLTRAADAAKAGHRVRALIRGTAVNHDGRTNGMTAPSPAAQRSLIERALDDARVAPEEVSYVEAHGTGTPLGDPIEMEALRETYGAGERACAVGSVKTNLGHLEAAAGIAGLIKAMLVLEHGVVPPHLHLDRMNPEIDLSGTRLLVPREATPLPEDAERRLAATSSFGFGGTNAHVVLEAAPPPPDPPDGERPEHLLLPISARSEAAVLALAASYAERLVDADADEVADLCAAAALGRSHHRHRICVTAEHADALPRALGETMLAGVPRPLGRDPRVAFVFSGQGSQWPGMGRDLLANDPVARAEIEACDEIVRDLVGWSLIDQLEAPPETSRLNETEVTQLTLCALQLALTARWREWGVVPEAVVGHSMAEVTAACAAGALDRAQALELLVHRAHVTERARGGAMASVRLDEDDVVALLDGAAGIEVAAVNGPASTVVAGERAVVEDFVGSLSHRGVKGKLLPVDYAFHSALLDGCEEELAALVGHIEARPAALAIYSTVTGGRVAPGELGARHWCRNTRGAVRFAAAVRALADQGFNAFVEVGAHPVLLANVTDVLDQRGREHVAVASLRRGEPAAPALRESLGRLYSAGYDVDWEAVVPRPRRPVRLPTYPWQRRRYWVAAGGQVEVALQVDLAGPDHAAPSGDLREAPPEMRLEMLTTYVRERVAAALELGSLDVVPPDAPLEALGMDSLKVVELKNQVELELGVVVPLTVLLEGGCPRDIARTLARAADGGDDDGGGDDDLTPARAAELLDNLDEMSDDDVDATLALLTRE